MAGVLLGLWVWHWASDVEGGDVAYALVVFRLDALGAIQGGDAADRATRLVIPLVGSGLGTLVICALAGIGRLRDRPVSAAALAAWLVGGLVGVALGGSYWAHYLIVLAPATAVGAAAMFAARPRAGALIVSIVVALGVVVSAGAAVCGAPTRHARDAVTVADTCATVRDPATAPM